MKLYTFQEIKIGDFYAVMDGIDNHFFTVFKKCSVKKCFRVGMIKDLSDANLKFVGCSCEYDHIVDKPISKDGIKDKRRYFKIKKEIQKQWNIEFKKNVILVNILCGVGKRYLLKKNLDNLTEGIDFKFIK